MNLNTILPPNSIYYGGQQSRGSYRGSPRDHSKGYTNHVMLPMTHEQEMKLERELEAYSAKMMEEFKIIDTNSDGFLTYSEVNDFLVKKVNLQNLTYLVGPRRKTKR